MIDLLSILILDFAFDNNIGPKGIVVDFGAVIEEVLSIIVNLYHKIFCPL
jgi:hypothetical protein